MPDRFPDDEQNVRRRVLWPIGITLVVFLFLFFAVFHIYLQRELSRNLDDHVTFVANLYRDFQTERSATMQSLIKQIQRNQVLTQALIRRDRQALLEEATPLFNEFVREQNITHIYFHQPDGVNLLRVHKPGRFGDQIDRLTLKRARSSGRVSSGAELGPLGTFTLRVVVPWFVGNQIIGYVEFGEEVEPLLVQAAAQTGSQMAILVKKSSLDKGAWQEGQEMLGRPLSWELLSEHVVTATTEDQLLKLVSRFATTPHLSGEEDIETSLLKQHYRGRYLPLVDASGREIGVMMVLKNINQTLNDHRASIVLVTIFCILFGGSLFISAYSVLGRTEQSLKTARQKLVDEIDRTHQANAQLALEVGVRRTAEQSLKEAYDKLEQRVVERTAQLDQQKTLLEKALAEARLAADRISGVMRSVDDALLVIDVEDKILLMNASASALLRQSEDELIGEKAASVIPLESLSDKVVEVLSKREGGVAFDFESGNRDRGTSLVMHVRSSVLTDPQGRYEGMIFLGRDVTRDRSMERLKSEFISVAAHELRTPMTVILGFSELLLNKDVQTADDRHEYAQIIHDKAASLSRLLDDMLDISRIEAGRGLELFIEKIQVEDLFMPTLRAYRKRVLGRQFDADLDDSELLLQVDRDKIAQVMDNLLSNAVKYSEEGSLITLSGRATNEGYHLTVYDKGIGMTPEQIGHAFDKFYRADNGDRSVKGTGLGLSIVKHIIEEHRGEIWLESQRGKETKVHLLLPIADS